MKLYRVFGLVQSRYYGLPAYEPCPELYFDSLHDALTFIHFEVFGLWSICCGLNRVAHGNFFVDFI